MEVTMSNQIVSNIYTQTQLVLAETNLAEIRPGPFQARLNFKTDAMTELVQSIEENGLIHEPVVFQNGHYLLIAGERRWRGLCALALKQVMPAAEALDLVCRPDAPARLLDTWRETLARAPVRVKVSTATDEKTWHLLAVIDNVQRENLTVIEEGQDYQSLRQRYGWSDRRIAQEVGVHEARVKSRRRWLKLEQSIQDIVAEGQLPHDIRVARALLSLPDPEARLKMAQYHSERRSSIKTIVASCEKLLEKLTEASTPAEAPGLPIFQDLQRPARGTSPPSGGLRQAAKRMCDACPGKAESAALANLPEPAWSIITAEAADICSSCPLLQARHLCGDCPGMLLLKNIVANYSGGQ
jgi:ParB-like chromosome segregation protein Spo0J